MPRLAALIPMLIACAAPLAGVELRVNDLRIAYTYMPDSGTDVQGDYEQFASDGSLFEFGTLYLQGLGQERQRASVGYFRSLRAMEAGRGSLVLGIEAIRDQRGDARRLEQDAWIADAFVGWAWPLTPAWHIEQGFVFGGGVQRNEFTIRRTADPGPDFEGEDEPFVYEYGFRMGARWTHATGIQLGLDASYLVQHSEVDVELEAADGARMLYEPEIRQEGFAFSAVLGYRL